MKWFLIISAVSLTAFVWALRKRPLPPAPSPVDEFGDVAPSQSFQVKSTLPGSRSESQARAVASTTASHFAPAARAGSVSPLHALASNTYLLLFAGKVTGKADYTKHPALKNVLPAWYNSTSVEQGGFVGPAADRKTIYEVYGSTYNGGFRPPGWFGYDAKGNPVEFSSTGSGAKAHGNNAILAEEKVIGRYPYADKPPPKPGTSGYPLK